MSTDNLNPGDRVGLKPQEASKAAAAPKKPGWGLIRRRSVPVPTWRGWLLVIICCGLLGMGFVLGIHPFLAMSEARSTTVLVVEGWLPDYALEAVAAEFKRGQYATVYVTGGPLEWGAPLSEYKNHAARGAATLAKLGMDPAHLQAVPAPLVRKDRTYVGAVALREWWQQHGPVPPAVTLVTLDAHARRSRLMFEKGLGQGVAVGVLAIPNADYDGRHWWRSSAGVRTVISEALAYLYTRFLFSEERSGSPNRVATRTNLNPAPRGVD